MLTRGGDQRRRAGGGGLRQPAAVERDGGAPVVGSRREGAPWTCLDVVQLLVSVACSGRTPSRRIGGGKPAAALDSAAWSGGAGAGGGG
jgi:hypothetical protein